PMQIEIKRIQRALGVTTIFVTHDQSEAMSMSDRIAVIEKGEIPQAATPLETYHKPQTRIVAGLIGGSTLVAATIGGPAADQPAPTALGICDYAPTESAVTDGQDVTLLIRPEHIRLSRNPIEGRKNVRMQVETIVNYGDNALVIGKVGDLQMRVRV